MASSSSPLPFLPSRTSLRIGATGLLLFSFSILLLNGWATSLSSPSWPTLASSPSPSGNEMATWSRSEQSFFYRKPPLPTPTENEGVCEFRSPLAHLPFARNIPAPKTASTLATQQQDIVHSAGVITVNEDNEGETHPMLVLIKQGENDFNERLARQSSSLEQARAEYERRNQGRSVPQGFDTWFAFAKEQDSLFPDEFDQLSASFAPWLKLSPRDRRDRLRDAETMRDGEYEEVSGKQSLVRVISDGMGGLGWEPLLSASPSSSPRYPPPSRHVERSPSHSSYVPTHTLKPNKRTKAMLDLLSPIRDLLPRFSIVMNCADQPMVLLSSSQKKRLSSRGDFAPSLLSDTADNAVTWEDVCRGTVPNNASDSTDGISFVSDVRKANDPCLHPKIQENHGLFLDHGKSTFKHVSHGRLLPIWSQSSTQHHSDLLVPAIGIDGRFPQPGKKDVDWNLKRSQIFWRGSLTGMSNVFSNPPRWIKSHRARLHLLANDADPRISEPVCAISRLGELVVKTAWKSTVAAWMDVKVASTIFWRWFSWWPEYGQQCGWLDGSCSQLKSYINFALKAPEDEVDLYRFALDVDGNSWSARFFRLLANKSLVIKSTIFTEWNTENHPDWMGYVPSHWSFRDLHSILAFFKGPVDGEGRLQDFEAYDEIARVMAENGKCFRERAWRIEDMQIYMLRALLEYARLFNDDDGDWEQQD